MNFFTSTSKVVFEVEIVVKDLENLPYISGLYYVKYNHRKSLTKGFSEKQTVRNNVVEWNSRIFIPETSMKIGKDGVLQPSHIDLYFRQDRDKGKRWDDLGTISINLAGMLLAIHCLRIR
jgi:hypothetical protein